MKVATHLRIAHAIAQHQPLEKTISRPFFYLGNILPDLCWLSRTHPHYPQRSLHFVLQQMEKMAKRHPGKRYDSLRLGIISHYLSDFCCQPHQKRGSVPLHRHLAYEFRQGNWFRKHWRQIARQTLIEPQPNICDFADLKENIYLLLNRYNQENPSYAWDMEMTLRVTFLLCRYLPALQEEAMLTRTPLSPHWAGESRGKLSV